MARAGRTPAQLSREFGRTAQTIANWIGAARRDTRPTKPIADALSSAEREELTRLRRQLRQVQMERARPGKGLRLFAAKSDKTFTPSSNS